MQKNDVSKPIFLASTIIGISCLFSSYGGDLVPYQVYKATIKTDWNLSISTNVLRFSPNQLIPHGAVKVTEKLSTDRERKIGLATLAALANSIGWLIASCKQDDWELEEFKKVASKESRLKEAKTRFAIMDKVKQQLIIDELNELVAMANPIANEVDEVESNKFVNASYLIQEGHSEDYAISQVWNIDSKSPEFTNIKASFRQWRDS